MTFFIDEVIPLTLRLTKNGRPISGATVTVRVVNQRDGLEILTSTPVLETIETGVYTFEWGTAPGEEIDLLVIFIAQNRDFFEFIKIRRKESVEEIQQVSVEVFQDQVVDVSVVQNDVVNIEVTPDPVVSILVDKDEPVFIDVIQQTVDIIVDCA